MLTLFSLYSYLVSYNLSEFNKESRHSRETFQQHYRSAVVYTLLPPDTHTHQAHTVTNTSIDAIEIDRQRSQGVKVCLCVCLFVYTVFLYMFL